MDVSSPPPGLDTDGSQSSEFPSLEGPFTSYRLVQIAGRLRALGWSEDRVRRQVYSPFIVAGRAAWVDTWGAPRYGPGSIVRSHEGQDVFCDDGTPVLASEEGIVEFGIDTGFNARSPIGSAEQRFEICETPSTVFALQASETANDFDMQLLALRCIEVVVPGVPEMRAAIAVMRSNQVQCKFVRLVPLLAPT